MSDSSDSVAYEAPNPDRPATTAPTEAQLEQIAIEHDPYVALRLRDFRAFIVSGLLKASAQQMQMVAVLWEINRHTNSAMKLGWVGLALGVPMLLLSLPAGHVADRFNRKKMMIAAWTFSGMCAVALAILSKYYTDSSWWLWGVYACLFGNGMSMPFARTARQSLLPQIIPRVHFTNAVTWSSSTMQVSSMLGPAIGGAVIALSIPSAYVLSAVLTFVSIVQALTIREPASTDTAASRAKTEEGGWRSLTAGVRFVYTRKLLFSAMTLDLLAVLLGGATYLLPMFAQRLGVGALGFGWLRAGPAIGAFIAAMIIAHSPPLKHAGRALLLCVAGYGLATIVFGLSSVYALSLAMLMLTGAFDNVGVVIRHSLIQLLTPDSMRGRVTAVNTVFVGSSDQLGGLESGLTAAWFGPVASVVGGGIGTILTVFWVAFTWPELRRFGSLQDAHAAEAPSTKEAAMPVAK